MAAKAIRSPYSGGSDSSDQGLGFVIHWVTRALGGFAVLGPVSLHIVRHRQSATPGGVVPNAASAA